MEGFLFFFSPIRMNVVSQLYLVYLDTLDLKKKGLWKIQFNWSRTK